MAQLSETALVSSLEAATYLRISNSTLAKWRVSGFGPKFSKLGRAVRYRIADLDEFVAKSSATSTGTVAGVRSLGGDSR